MQKLEKKSLQSVTMVTKILTRYISVRVQDGPIVTIIHRYEFIYYSLSFCTKASHFAPRHLTSGDLEGHKRSYEFLHEFLQKYAFSQLVFELVTSGESKIMVISMRREFPRSPGSLSVS